MWDVWRIFGRLGEVSFFDWLIYLLFSYCLCNFAIMFIIKGRWLI